MRPPYAPHAAYAAAALTGPGLGRTVLGAFLVVGSFVAVPETIAVMLLSDNQLGGFLTGTTPGGVIAGLAGFAIPVLMLSLVLRRLHGRRIETVIGPLPLAGRQFLSVAVAVFGVSLAQEILPPWPTAMDIAAVRPLGQWLTFLPVGLAMILLQTSAEELFFRGYLQQQLAVLSTRPLVWMVLPSMLFGLVHYWNAPGPAEGALWAIWAGLLGLACADLTGRCGTLGPAIALHFVNNIFAFLLWGMQDGPDSGLALLLYPQAPEGVVSTSLQDLWTPWNLFSLATLSLGVLVMWLAARIAVRR